MSEQEEEADSQNAVDSSKQTEDALGSIDIPVPSESDQTEGYESELDPSGGGREKRVEDLSDQSRLPGTERCPATHGQRYDS